MTTPTALVVSFIISAVVALASTPLARWLAVRAGAVAYPGERHIHKEPTASWGGIAIIFGFIVSGPVIGRILGMEQISSRQLTALIVGSGIIVIMALVDDRYRLPARFKFLTQLVAAGFFALPMFGAGITVISNPVSSDQFFPPLWLGWFLTTIWVVAVTNAVNLIDGVDGLAAGVSGIACLTLAAIAASRGQTAVAILAAALAGGSLGFLPWNFNPARIFMGDTGAYFIGFVIGGLTVMGAFKVAASISIFVPILVLAVPLLDAGLSTVRRYLKGQPVFAADRDHLHHRLLDMGFSQRAICAVMYSVTAICCLIALWISRPHS